jgi:thioredoxin reductase
MPDSFDVVVIGSGPGAYAAQFLDFTRKLLEDTSTFA